MAQLTASLRALPRRRSPRSTPTRWCPAARAPACSGRRLRQPGGRDPARAAPCRPDPDPERQGGPAHTPTSNAEAVAAAIPGAQVEVVGPAGHSVLDSDVSGCAVQARWAPSWRRRRCPTARRPTTRGTRSPSPRLPDSIAMVPELHGVRGERGRVLEAVLLSLERVHQDEIDVAVDRDVAKGHHHDIGAVRGGFVAIARSSSGYSSSATRLRCTATRSCPGCR